MKTNFLFQLVFSFLFILLLISSSSEAQSISGVVEAIYVFGDSLVDVGNNNHLAGSLAKANFPHNGLDFPTRKATGRFSNGKNAADFIVEKVGLASAAPYLSILKSKSNKTDAFLAGVNFASGGAGVFDGTDQLLKQSIPLTKQVEYYSMVYGALVQGMGSATAQQHLSKSLFPIVIGSNDLLGYFKSGSDVSKKSTPQQFVDSMLSAVNEVLKRLHDVGARKFVLVGIGAIGCIPMQRAQSKGEECNGEVNFWAKKYNDGLESVLQAFKSEFKDINYSFFDAYAAFLNLIQNPATYGFTEVKAACCGLGKLKAQAPCTPVSTYCSNRDDHLFWDLYHPSQKTAGMFVDMLFDGSQYVTPINGNQLYDSICLENQLGYYTRVYDTVTQRPGNDAAVTHFKRSIFVITIGGNDLFVYSTTGSNPTLNTTPQQYVDYMISNLKQFLKAIIKGTEDDVTGLEVGASSLVLLFFDTYAFFIFIDMLQNPGTYGFTETKAACCGVGNLKAEGPCTPEARCCPNRNDHLFWDLFHPTQATSAIFAKTNFVGSRKYATRVLKLLVQLPII